MADNPIAQARRQNESLEKSLKLLRGKLSGARDEKASHFSNDRTLRPTGNSNLRSVHKTAERSDPINIRIAAGPKQTKDTELSKPSSNKSANGKSGIIGGFRRNPRESARSSFVPSKHEENYFNEFRNKVHKIRKANQDSKNASNEILALKEPVSSKTAVASKSAEPKQLLVEKIRRQHNLISDLENEVNDLRIANNSLSESQDILSYKLQRAEIDLQKQRELHHRELVDLEASFNFHNLNLKRNIRTNVQDQDSAAREERIHLQVQLDQSRKENTELRARVNEIAERAQFLSSIHEQRLKSLESKLQASIGVAKYYCELSGSQWGEEPEDSTKEILFGAQENTTIALLKGVPGFGSGPKTGKKSLRSYFLAVLFMVRLKNETEANRIWEPYIELGNN